MAWRLAKSLVVLKNEVLTLHPGTTVWDIGDQAHQDEASDHNPNACCDVVCATDTLANAGLDLAWYAEKVRQAGINGHPAPKYVIFNRRIASRGSSWGWRTYTGSNPHTTHVHVSVGVGPDGHSVGPYDDTSPWGLIEEEDMPLSDEDKAAIRRIVDQVVWDEKIISPSLGVPDPGRGHKDWWVKQGRQAVVDIGELSTKIDGLVTSLDQAVHLAIRNEFAALVPTLTAQLVDELGDELGEAIPAQVVESVVRRVLGSLDEIES